MTGHAPRGSRVIVTVLMTVTAVFFFSSIPFGWGSADAPDGTRYKVSPIGVSHVLELHQTVSPTVDCRWAWSATLPTCAYAANAQPAVIAVHAVVYLIGLAGVIVSIGALNTIRPKKRRWPSARLAGSAALVAIIAIVTFAFAVPRASLDLQGHEFGVGGTRGILQMAIAITLLLGFTAARVPATPGPGTIAFRVAAAALGVATFVSLFPLLGALAFAIPCLAIGVAVGGTVRGRAPTPDALAS